MTSGKVLKELAQQVRSDTLQLLDATEDRWLTWAPPGTSNHILWHAGHALWLQDLMCVEPLSGRTELPKGWAVFGQGSQPGTFNEWSSREEVRLRLQTQLERMLKLFDQTPEEQFLQQPARLSNSRNTLGWIIHGLHDEAKHTGEMYLIWKLCQQQR